MKTIGQISTGLLFIVITSILSGYALSILWEWFVMSAFNVPKINIPTAIGLSLMINYLTHQDIPKNDDKEFGEILLEGIIKGITKPIVSLCIGWIVTLFL